MKHLLNIKHIRVSYGEKNIIPDISFSIGAGEFCALLGLNGSGKTTLLRAVCGLNKVEQGSIEVNEKSLNIMKEHQRARLLSYIPQRSSTMEGFTILDVVLMGLNPHLSFFQSPSLCQREMATKILAEVGMLGCENVEFNKISEGQKQLVIFARALLQDAPVMLMDEPDSALDFVNRNIVLGHIRKAIHEKNKVGLITLHDPNFALAFCDRVLLLKAGNIVGDINIKNSSTEEIRAGLSMIYGDVDLIEHNGKHSMFAC